MRELAFIIESIEKENDFFKFSMKGYSEELTYELELLIKQGLPAGTMDSGEHHFHENAMILRRKNDLSDNVLLALSRKYKIDLKQSRMIDEKKVFNMFPIAGDPSKPDQKPIELKCFLGDGSVEFYVSADPSKKILTMNSRGGCEEGFLDELMNE